MREEGPSEGTAGDRQKSHSAGCLIPPFCGQQAAFEMASLLQVDLCPSECLLSSYPPCP